MIRFCYHLKPVRPSRACPVARKMPTRGQPNCWHEMPHQGADGWRQRPLHHVFGNLGCHQPRSVVDLAEWSTIPWHHAGEIGDIDWVYQPVHLPLVIASTSQRRPSPSRWCGSTGISRRSRMTMLQEVHGHSQLRLPQVQDVGSTRCHHGRYLFLAHLPV